MEGLKPSFIDNTIYNNLQIGKYIYTDISLVQANSIVLFSVNEYRGSDSERYCSFRKLRNNFFELAAGNWELPIFDIGMIDPGNTIEDTYFLVQKTSEYILEKNAIPIMIGGSQDLILSQYQALTNKNRLLNYTAIDSHIPIEQYLDSLNEENYITRLISDPKQLLFQFTNIGYQSYYTSYKLLDTLAELDFDAIRLGEIVSNLRESEPVLRSTDICSINLNAIQMQSIGSNTFSNPNGFDTREICALAKYVGLSPQMKTIGLFNYLEKTDDDLFAKLVAQILWYVIEGLNARNKMKEIESSLLTYRVLHEDKELVFVKDERFEKWWILLENTENQKDSILIPCSYLDYKKATEGEMPDRYWKNIKRFL